VTAKTPTNADSRRPMAGEARKLAERWLLLLHQLPTQPSKARVKTWRRLQQIGAIPLRNSAYVLPNSDQSHEDFEWMKSEIVAMGGEATVVAANMLDADADAEIVSAFRKARERDYKGFLTDLAALERKTRTAPSPGRHGQSLSVRRTVRAARDRLADIVAIDFFSAAGRSEAEAALARVEAKILGPAARGTAHGYASPGRIGDYLGRVWVTRPRPGVDRMASAWLIRTFIDPQAVFKFSDKPSELQIPFDMYGGQFSHQGGLCTFEVLSRTFELSDRAVARIAEIVHDLDLKDARFRPPEAPTVGALVEGIRATDADDDVALQRGIDLFQALYRSMAGAIQPAAVRRRRTRATSA
jgi:hypothetical protein